jgi:hypothetical protein
LPQFCKKDEQARHSPSNRLQSALKVLHKRWIGLFDAAGSANDDMVGARNASFWQNRPRHFPEPAFHSVADNGVADFLRDRKSNPHLRIIVFARTNQQNKAARGSPFSLVGGQKL